MAAPSSPYATATQVAYLLQHRFRGATPGAGSTPPDTTIEQFIAWTDAVIEANFQTVGYKIPFVEMAGETWPTMQTNLLAFMSCLGTAAMVGGFIFMPALLGRGSPGAQGNVYADNFTKMLVQVQKNGYHFRADYYNATQAEQWIADAYGPRGDFQEDYWDPTRFWLLQQYTTEVQKVFDEITEMDIDWDYLYNLRTASAN
jgi:hypothetical protein